MGEPTLCRYTWTTAEKRTVDTPRHDLSRSHESNEQTKIIFTGLRIRLHLCTNVRRAAPKRWVSLKNV